MSGNLLRIAVLIGFALLLAGAVYTVRQARQEAAVERRAEAAERRELAEACERAAGGEVRRGGLTYSCSEAAEEGLLCPSGAVRGELVGAPGEQDEACPEELEAGMEPAPGAPIQVGSTTWWVGRAAAAPVDEAGNAMLRVRLRVMNRAGRRSTLVPQDVRLFDGDGNLHAAVAPTDGPAPLPIGRGLAPGERAAGTAEFVVGERAVEGSVLVLGDMASRRTVTASLPTAR